MPGFTPIGQDFFRSFRRFGDQIRNIFSQGAARRPPDQSPNFLERFAAFEFVGSIRWAVSSVGDAIGETYSRFADWLTGSPPQPPTAPPCPPAPLPGPPARERRFTLEEEMRAFLLVREAAYAAKHEPIEFKPANALRNPAPEEALEPFQSKPRVAEAIAHEPRPQDEDRSERATEPIASPVVADTASLLSPEELRNRLRKLHRPPALNRVKEVMVKDKTPPPDVFVAAMTHTLKKKMTGEKRRTIGFVKRSAAIALPRPRKESLHPEAPTKPSAAPKPASAKGRMLRKTFPKKQAAAHRRINGWARTTPPRCDALVAQHGHSLALLRTAGHAKAAELHHAARRVIDRFKVSVHDSNWQQAARRVLSSEFTVCKVADAKQLRKDCKKLAAHFHVYSDALDPSALAQEELDDLRALGTIISDLSQRRTTKPSAVELKEAALLVLERDLETSNSNEYLLGDGEGAELAGAAMQQNLEKLTNRAASALSSALTHSSADAAIVGRSELSTMTRQEAEAVCRLMDVFLNGAYDFADEDQTLRERLDEISQDYLSGAARAIERRGKAVENFLNVRNFLVDAVVLLPLQRLMTKTKPAASAVRIGTFISYLAPRLFKAGREFTGLSEAARPVFEDYVAKNGDKARNAITSLMG